MDNNGGTVVASNLSVVGIGASAGGLDAFRLLLAEMPVDTGFAFVLIQHLDPTHHSSLSEILGRATTMPQYGHVRRRGTLPMDSQLALAAFQLDRALVLVDGVWGY